mmetsp:Transcript_64176/g.142720  ORF Transcript_64176/g.142720 Transcript_64176/m.142720 type:complete len:485 (-) Transcript_64176:73-1527(-)
MLSSPLPFRDVRLLVLWAAFLLGSHAARLDVATASKDMLQEDMDLEARRFQPMRLRAFNASGIQMLLDGADLSLTAPSSLEEEEQIELPSAWQSKLKIVRKLGEGSFGKVFKCKVLCDASPDTFVTVKLIQEDSDMIKREIDILRKMQGVTDLCVSAVGSPSAIKTKKGSWIMMPLMNKGELFDFITLCHNNMACNTLTSGKRSWHKLGVLYNLQYILALFHDIVKGVEILHYKTGMLHTDLKPENVMLSCQGMNCFAAVIDLGLMCDPKLYECGVQGTPGYISPEVWAGDAQGMQNPARDVWSLGVILYNLMYPYNPPFYGDSNGIKTRIYNPSLDPAIPTPRDSVDNLVIAMLNPSYTERPSLRTVRKTLEAMLAADPVANEMATKTPTERGAQVQPPVCLSAAAPTPTPRPLQHLSHHVKQHHGKPAPSLCADMPTVTARHDKCQMKIWETGTYKCCTCHVRYEGGQMYASYYKRHMNDSC